jgi:predicted amidophosphoribosyltransferase
MKKIISKLKKNSNTEKETEIENVDKDEIINLDGKDLIIKKEHPFNEVCKSCGGQIKNIKYICVICPDCILCQKCESIHIHPVLKCKSIQLSSLKSVYIYMNKRNKVIQSFLKNEKDSSVFGLFQDIFSAKYEINLSSPINKITMRPNKSIKIPITIQNLSSTKIECKLLQLYLLAKNIKDLKIYNYEIDLVINKREQNDIYMTVESNNHIGEYNFNVELYSIKNIKLKSNVLNFNIIVNDDEEEEELNETFKDYLNIVVASKETKMGIKKIMENEDIKEDPITIFQFLKNNNNNVEKTIENLISKNSDNINKNIL